MSINPASDSHQTVETARHEKSQTNAILRDYPFSNSENLAYMSPSPSPDAISILSRDMALHLAWV